MNALLTFKGKKISSNKHNLDLFAHIIFYKP